MAFWTPPRGGGINVQSLASCTGPNFDVDFAEFCAVALLQHLHSQASALHCRWRC